MVHRTIAGLIVLMLGACAPIGQGAVGKLQQSTTTEEIIELVDALPPWSRAVYGSTEIAQLNEIVDELRTYSLSELEDAIVYLYESGEVPRDDVQDSKTFLILRALFAVPTSESVSVAKSFGGWMRPELFLTSTPTTVNLRWPLTLNTMDEVTGVAPFLGYAGTYYDAVGEFEFFEDKYGLR